MAKHRAVASFHLLLAYCLLCPCLVQGQTDAGANDDELRAVIVLARHGVRAPIESEIRDSAYNAQPWPSWPAEPGVLTQHGTDALRLLGDYYRLRYPTLLPNPGCEHAAIYVEANTSQRTIASAKAMMSGIAPGCSVQVNSRTGRNPLFSPAEGPAVDKQKLRDAGDGKIGNQPDWFTHAFAAPLDRMHHVLMDCSGAPCDTTKPDFRTTIAGQGTPSPRSARTESPVQLGADFAENFLLQYTEGMPMEQIGWGRVSRADLDYLMEMNTRFHDFVLRTPYFAQVGASDLAAHIRDTIEGSATGHAVPGQLGTPQDRFVLLTGHDSNLSWLGGLLRLEWLLPDQTFNATTPGSALVFEIHRSKATGASSVRVLFISQTLDQIRYLKPLNGAEQPAVAAIFVPGCSGPAPAYACSIQDFARVVSAAVDNRMVEPSAHR